MMLKITILWSLSAYELYLWSLSAYELWTYEVLFFKLYYFIFKKLKQCRAECSRLY